MKPLINKDNLYKASTAETLWMATKKDLIGQLKDFPLGVVIRILEEVKLQGNKPDIKLFQERGHSCTSRRYGGFDWRFTEAGYEFWYDVFVDKKFFKFFEKYPEYKKYDL